LILKKCLSKYVAVYVRTDAGLCHALRRHARLRLNLNLDLNLNLFLFQQSFKKPNASSLASKSIADLVPSLNLNLSLFLVRWHPPGRPPVRYPHGRIVVPAAPDYYI
jgi:hypothetical protein